MGRGGGRRDRSVNRAGKAIRPRCVPAPPFEGPLARADPGHARCHPGPDRELRRRSDSPPPCSLSAPPTAEPRLVPGRPAGPRSTTRTRRATRFAPAVVPLRCAPAGPAPVRDSPRKPRTRARTCSRQRFGPSVFPLHSRYGAHSPETGRRPQRAHRGEHAENIPAAAIRTRRVPPWSPADHALAGPPGDPRRSPGRGRRAVPQPSGSRGARPAGRPSASRVMVSTRASACFSSVSQRRFRASPRS